MRNAVHILLATSVLGAITVARAAPNGPLPVPDSSSAPGQASQAKLDYNAGVAVAKKADAFAAEAAHTADPGKQHNALAKAQDRYAQAREQFTAALESDQSL